MLIEKWYDHDLIWDFYDRLFDSQFDNFLEFVKSNWERDVYDGVDGDIVFINNDISSIPTQLKTGGHIQIKGLKLNLSYKNDYGRDSMFGVYFKDDHIGKLELFVFGFPFIGAGLFIKYESMRRVWNENFEDWVDLYGKNGNGDNKYIQISGRTFLRAFKKDEWVFVKDVENVDISLLSV